MVLVLTGLSCVEPIPGLRVCQLSGAKWKNLSIDICCQVPIARNRVTHMALVPRLARRGTRRLPTLKDLSRWLDELYGATMGAETTKIGPLQVVRFGMDLPSPRFLAEGEKVVREAVRFLWDLVTDPHLVNGQYPPDRFKVEVDEHRRDILGLINNRPRYATVKLMELVSQGDERGLPAWGILEDLDELDAKATWTQWCEVLSHCPISVYAIGEGSEYVLKVFESGDIHFPEPRDGIYDVRREVAGMNPPVALLEQEESLPGEQTVIAMAFHTGITEEHPELPAMLAFDGILGGFPHSKLFANIREKEGLAYFADTAPNTWRGLVVAVAGVDDRQAMRVMELIQAQLEAIKRGQISDDELEFTRVGLIRRYLSESDSQSALVRRFLTREILGGPGDEEEFVKRILAVSVGDVVRVAENTRLVARYVVHARGETPGE